MGDRAASGGGNRRRGGGFVRTRLLPGIALLSGGLGCLVVAQFVLGRAMTDRSHATQYLWWIPPAWTLLAAWALLMVSWLAGWASLRTKGLMLRPLLLVGCLGITGWVLIGEWSVHRYLTGGGSAEPSERALRVVHWNLSSRKIREGGSWERLPDLQADVILIANPRWGNDQRTLLRSLAGMAPAEEWFTAGNRYNVRSAPGHSLILQRGLIVSRLPIRRAGVVSAGPVLNPENESRPTGEHGWVIFAELERTTVGADGTELTEPFVVWFVDLPSDPMAWRMKSMRAMRSVIDAWDGRTRVVEGDRWVTVETDGTFPEPDLVIGDFNALRGSASLDALAPGYTDAFAERGRGTGRSWLPRVGNRVLRQPLKLSSWQIDLALVGPDWHTAGYRLDDTGAGPHRMQVVDLTPADVPGG